MFLSSVCAWKFPWYNCLHKILWRAMLYNTNKSRAIPGKEEMGKGTMLGPPLPL